MEPAPCHGGHIATAVGAAGVGPMASCLPTAQPAGAPRRAARPRFLPRLQRLTRAASHVTRLPGASNRVTGGE